MQHYLRTTIALFGIFSVFMLPPLVAVLCVIALAVRYRAWEALLIGVLIDLTWLPGGTLVHTLPLFSMLVFIVVWGLEPLRAQFLMGE